MDMETKTETIVVCPNCDADLGPIDHVMNENQIGPWYCDECCTGYMIYPKEDRIEKTKVWPYSSILLRYEDLLVVVRGHENTWDHQKYFYEMHSCPVNSLREAATIIDLKKRCLDPHGMFRFIGQLPWPVKDSHRWPLSEEVDQTELMKSILDVADREKRDE